MFLDVSEALEINVVFSASVNTKYSTSCKHLAKSSNTTTKSYTYPIQSNVCLLIIVVLFNLVVDGGILYFKIQKN